MKRLILAFIVSTFSTAAFASLSGNTEIPITVPKKEPVFSEAFCNLVPQEYEPAVWDEAGSFYDFDPGDQISLEINETVDFIILRVIDKIWRGEDGTEKAISNVSPYEFSATEWESPSSWRAIGGILMHRITDRDDQGIQDIAFPHLKIFTADNAPLDASKTWTFTTEVTCYAVD